MAPRPLLAFLLVALAATAAGAQRRPTVAWSELEYEGSKLGFTMRAAVSIQRLSHAEIDWALVEPQPGDWLKAPEAGGWLLQLETDGLGTRTAVELLLDDDGSSLQRVQRRSGRRLKSHLRRTHRFAAASIHIGTVRPAAEERTRPSQEWSQTSHGIEILPTELGSTPLSQPAALFYTLATADLARPGDRASAHMFTKGRVLRVELVAESWENIAVDHAVEHESGSWERQGSSKALAVRLSGAEVGGDGDDADFQFLGLRDDVRIYLDTQTRVPVRITGRVSLFGRVVIDLDRVRLR